MSERWDSSEKEPNYVWEMLKSTPNVYAGLIAAAVGGVLALPFGLGVGALPILTWVAGDAIASMFIPGSAVFKSKVDKRFDRKRRERIRRHLLDEIRQRFSKQDKRLGVYNKICDRIKSLSKLASNRRTVIGSTDIDRLENASIDYLGMWIAHAGLEEREKQLNVEELDRKILDLDEQIESASPANRQRLQQARSDLKELLTTARRLGARKSGLEAALLSLPDSIEELYHAMVTNPVSADATEKLQDAVAKMRIEEDLDLAVDDELENIEPMRKELRVRRQAAREHQQAHQRAQRSANAKKIVK